MPKVLPEEYRKYKDDDGNSLVHYIVQGNSNKEFRYDEDPKEKEDQKEKEEKVFVVNSDFNLKGNLGRLPVHFVASKGTDTDQVKSVAFTTITHNTVKSVCV